MSPVGLSDSSCDAPPFPNDVPNPLLPQGPRVWPPGFTAWGRPFGHTGLVVLTHVLCPAASSEHAAHLR